MTRLSTKTPTPTKTPSQFDSTRAVLRLNAAGHTITGTRNQVNQDRFLVDNQRGLYAIADGMGGCRAGERAAHMAITLLAGHPALLCRNNDDCATIRRAIRQAFLDVNHEIVAAASADARLYGMGTTMVMGMMIRNRMYIASLGDSRAYLLRDGNLQQCTVDHNMAEMLVSQGVISRQDAREHQWRHMLWQYLGLEKLIDGPDINVIHTRPGDRVALVTDGVTETLTDRDLTMILNMHFETDAAAEALARSAVARGTRDDATSVVINVT